MLKQNVGFHVFCSFYLLYKSSSIKRDFKEYLQNLCHNKTEDIHTIRKFWYGLFQG